MRKLFLALLISGPLLFGNELVETAVLAGGCFWGVEGVFEEIKGVVEVRSGYSGGKKSTAKYRIVSSGKTDHAESVEVVYNPSIINYSKLLEVFFLIVHDPTQLNYQGPDVGREYRSAIFYNSKSQRDIALDYIEELEEKRIFSTAIVTEVQKLDKFYPAEDYHQDFIKKNPDNAYVCYWDIPKIEELKKKYPELVK